MSRPKTMVEKIWDRHMVRSTESEPFATAVAARLATGGWLVVDYVRLNFLVRRAV